jgi:hypothetical protein
MNDTTYQPLTLTKHRDDRRYGTMTMFGQTFKVKVSTFGTRYGISVVNEDGGDLAGKVYRKAGLLRREGGYYQVMSFDADSNSRGTGYRESGTLASNVERVVAGFLNERKYAAEQAAKTPEQREAEAKAVEEAGRKAQVARAREDVLNALDSYLRATGVMLTDDETLQAGLDAALAAMKGN